MGLQKLALAPIAVALMAIGVVSPAAAQSWSFDFGTRFSTTGPTPSTSFAHLSVTTTDYKTFLYDLTIGNNLNSAFGSTGTFVSNLRVNTASNQDPISSAIDSSQTWGVSKVALDTTTNNAGSVAWDFSDAFCGTSGGCNSNASLSRLTQGEEVKWTTTFASVQNPTFGTPEMLLKVQGFGGSADYTPTSPIPEPETYAMLLAGLGLLGFAARRRKLKEAATA